MKYLKLFDNHNDYDAYTDNMITPNVSYCLLEDEVHFNEFVDSRIVAKFNVTSTSQPTQICGYKDDGIDIYDSSTYFSKIEIDGVEMTNKTYQYTFSSVGEHIVKYTLINPEELGDSAFASCPQLTNITIPNSVSIFGYSIFYECTGLLNIKLPKNIGTIPGNFFYGCTGLQSFVIPETVEYISESAFQRCTSLEHLEIRSTVLTGIDASAFSECSSLVNITLPDSISEIASEAFKDCSSLETINMPQSLTTIGKRAFDGCENLSCSITLPSTTTTIGHNAFDGCPLTQVTCLATTPPSVYVNRIIPSPGLPTNISTFGFSNQTSPDAATYPLYVPSSSLSEYKSSTNANVNGYHTWGKYYAHRTYANPN